MIRLNYRDSRPIYEQIRDEFRHLVVTGALQEGDKLPSVRALASQLAINPNTIQRAYMELEGEGWVYSVPGKGSFVAGQKQVDTARLDSLLADFDEAVRELLYLGQSVNGLRERLEAAARAVDTRKEDDHD